jgi:hypothetical protein
MDFERTPWETYACFISASEISKEKFLPAKAPEQRRNDQPFSISKQKSLKGNGSG